jgi:uracil-DNA glycosylase
LWSIALPQFKIALIGEAWGEQEETYQMPFVGPAGEELTRMLEDAGINRNECFLTNTFNLRPRPTNDVGNLCGGARDPDVARHLPPLVPGKYLRSQYLGEIDRLIKELEEVRPNIAVLLGNTPSWALLGQTAISKNRGACSLSYRLPWLKCLPTYHPSYILRVWDDRHVTVLDFLKAKTQAEFPDLRRPARELWIEPSLEDIRTFKRRYLDDARRISFDIETAGDHITCIGFAPTRDRAIVIPFTDQRSADGCYWDSAEEELAAWSLVAEILAGPSEKVAQNGLYDMQFLWQKYGVPVRNFVHDTMLLHHSLMPESAKGLGFLGSVYTDEVAWKAIHARRGEKTIKREE